MRCSCCDYDDTTDSLFHNSTTETLKPRTFVLENNQFLCHICLDKVENTLADYETKNEFLDEGILLTQSDDDYHK